MDVSAKAHIDKYYVGRVALLATMFLAFSAWFLYDGYVKYPRNNHVAMEFERFEKRGIPRDVLVKEWNDHATANGLPTLEITDTESRPGKKHSPMDMLVQKGLGFALLPLGLLFGYSVIRLYGRWIAADSAGLTTSWGKKVAFGDITKLNKERWKTKGIAVVHYRPTGETGGERKLVLDDWKYDRAQTTALVEAVESRLKPEQIIADPAAAAAAASPKAAPAPEST